jgi:hypothetical protein
LMNLEYSSIPDSIKYYRTDEQTSEFEVSIWIHRKYQI